MKQYNIKCPYCFDSFNDTEVHFRVPFVKDLNTSVLPDGCDSIEEVEQSSRFTDDEKKAIVRLYNSVNFYAPQDDPRYEAFWEQYDAGVDGFSLSDKYPHHKRRVVVPERDIEYLKQVVPAETKTLESCFIRECVDTDSDEVTFVRAIELDDYTICTDRICPRCHNSLPNLYGAYPVKFIPVAGITASGKTVYLSQLCRHITSELPKVGYSVKNCSWSLADFVEHNPINEGKELPYGTSPQSIERPIFIDISSEKKNGTIVLYDVPGEMMCPSPYPMASECIMNADAIIMLIDPMQFSKIWDVLRLEENALDAPNAAVLTLHSVLGLKAESIPFAACISKCDEIYDVMPPDLVNILKTDYKGIQSEDNSQKMKALLNAEDFNSYEEKLADFVRQNALAFETTLACNFYDYSYFALSSIGCRVDIKTSDSGDSCAVPRGPVSPKRIMDPFYWIMYKLDLIGASGGLFNPNGEMCLNPDCRKQTTIRLNESVEIETGLLRKRKRSFTHYCQSCKCYFNPDSGDYYLENADRNR